MKDYLISDKINLEEKKLLFAMKTRAINVKTNFHNKLICCADFVTNLVKMNQNST